MRTLVQRIETLRSQGSGYAEVSRAGWPFPWLAFSFAGERAVVHQFTSLEQSLLMRGDGSAGDDVVVDVPVQEQLTPFTGAYVSTIDRALGAVTLFVAGVVPAELGDWERL